LEGPRALAALEGRLAEHARGARRAVSDDVDGGTSVAPNEPMDTLEIAAVLREIAAYLELDGERFRARAYLRGATSLESAPDAERLLREGRTDEREGVGESLAGLIAELARRGTASTLERLRARWPASVVALSVTPGVGPVKARRLFEAFGARSLDEFA